MRGMMRAGEPVVVVVAKGIGATLPYEFRDREGRGFLLNWDVKLDGHVMRVPWHVWMAEGGRLAEVMLNQRRLPFAMVVLVEWEGMKKEAGGNEKADEVVLKEGEVPTTGRSPGDEEDVLCYSRMREMLGCGAMRLRALGWALDMEERELREMLERVECPAVVTATGWVKLRGGMGSKDSF